MSFINTATIQRPLPFNFSCSDCPLKKQGYCEGVEDLKTYSMEHSSLIGCYDVDRIKTHFIEIGKRLIPPPEDFFQDKINFSELPLGVADGRIDLTQHSNIPLFVISMNDFIKNSGDRRFTDMAHLKKTFKLPLNSKVALIGTSSEKIQQAVWRGSEKFQIWKRIAEFGFEWATSLTFPVWDINPRSDQVIFQLRNYLTTDLLASYGLPVIPFVYPYNDTDYLTFKNWIQDRPSINKIAIYARYYKTDEQFTQLLKNVERILDCAEREIQILMVGVIKKSKIRQTLARFNNASIVSWSPYCEGYLKGKLYDNNLISKQRLDIEKSEVIYRNYLTLSEVIKNLRVEANNLN